MQIQFPPVEYADEHGFLGIGANLEIETLLTAYKSGIFPWPISGIQEIPWFSPPERAILFIYDFNLNKRALRQLRNSSYNVKIDTCFEEVIENCSLPRIDKEYRGKKKKLTDSWITEELKDAYINLHKNGHAHSIEVFKDNLLVGGLYGVKIGCYFSAESMFGKENNASKMALFTLTELLKSINSNWIDCQVLTPHLEKWGAKLINRSKYLKLLDDEIRRPVIELPKGELNLFRSSS